MGYVRRAVKAGTWYERKTEVLKKQLSDFLGAAEKKDKQKLVKAIIGPHAGLEYCGETMAHAYKQIDASKYDRVFMLGLSHRFYLPNFAVSNATHYNSPIINFTVDTDITSQMKKLPYVKILDQKSDEEEHSLELHLPLLAEMFSTNRSVKVVPLLVGSIKENDISEMTSFLLPYFSDPKNLFVVSSDFCHWGARFDFMSYYGKDIEGNEVTDSTIYKGIEAMDRDGMANIESKSRGKFENYMNNTQNTICGKNPIRLLLSLIEATGAVGDLEFLHYSQSSKVKSANDSSVSYASACYWC